MNKRPCVLVFLCMFVLSPAIVADDDGITVVEHLYWYCSGIGEDHYLTIDDPSRHFTESEPMLTFHVPPSRKSNIIFFELGSLSQVWWLSGYSPQEFSSALMLRLVSDVIPDDIMIKGGCFLEGTRAIAHPDPGSRTIKNNFKIFLRRNGLLREYRDWNWTPTYISTGEPVPKEEANKILNKLIDKGFDVEVTQYVLTEGATKTWLILYYIDVTRHTKIEIDEDYQVNEQQAPHFSQEEVSADPPLAKVQPTYLVHYDSAEDRYEGGRSQRPDYSRTKERETNEIKNFERVRC